jgi:hypothetical protein
LAKERPPTPPAQGLSHGIVFETGAGCLRQMSLAAFNACLKPIRLRVSERRSLPGDRQPLMRCMRHCARGTKAGSDVPMQDHRAGKTDHHSMPRQRQPLPSRCHLPAHSRGSGVPRQRVGRLPGRIVPIRLAGHSPVRGSDHEQQHGANRRCLLHRRLPVGGVQVGKGRRETVALLTPPSSTACRRAVWKPVFCEKTGFRAASFDWRSQLFYFECLSIHLPPSAFQALILARASEH